MPGGLMQLVAYGAQDIYLTGNPQISFFKVVYRRHTNFSIESIRQTFSGTADFGKDLTATISRNGDLLYRVYLEHSCEFTPPEPLSGTKGNWSPLSNVYCVGLCERYGDSLIKECEIEIGGQKIDKHTSMWNRVWSDLTEQNDSGLFGFATNGDLGPGGRDDVTGSTDKKNIDVGSGNGTQGGTLSQIIKGNGLGLSSLSKRNENSLEDFANFSHEDSPDRLLFGLDSSNSDIVTVNGFTYNLLKGSINTNKIFLPLQFWFCRNSGLALPLIALQYHDVKIKLKIEDLKNLVRINTLLNNSISNPFTQSPYTRNTPPHLGVFPIYRTNIPMPSTLSEFDLWCDYIFLDTDERRRFAQVSHEYLIEQVQSFTKEINREYEQIPLNFNHPVKELIWVTRNEGSFFNNNNHRTLANLELSDSRCGKLLSIRLGGGNGEPLDLRPEIIINDTGYLSDFTAGPVSADTMGGKWGLELNGQDRFKKRDSKYFTRTQIWQHHSGFGALPTYGYPNNTDYGDSQDRVDFTGGGNGYRTMVGNDSIAVYSFALKPEEHQPSGTCNFSRIDNALLVGEDLKIAKMGSNVADVRPGESQGYSTHNMNITVFAVNYNVLRIMSGMGGLAYSN